MPISQSTRQSMLDEAFPASTTDHIALSEDGATETTLITRAAVGEWAPASAATPSVKSNANALTTAAATGAGTITHFAVFSASTGGTQKTDWEELASPRTVASGDTLNAAAGAIDIIL